MRRVRVGECFSREDGERNDDRRIGGAGSAAGGAGRRREAGGADEFRRGVAVCLRTDVLGAVGAEIIEGLKGVGA
jgi:hypothetical protein